MGIARSCHEVGHCCDAQARTCLDAGGSLFGETVLSDTRLIGRASSTEECLRHPRNESFDVRVELVGSASQQVSDLAVRSAIDNLLQDVTLVFCHRRRKRVNDPLERLPCLQHKILIHE